MDSKVGKGSAFYFTLPKEWHETGEKWEQEGLFGAMNARPFEACTWPIFSLNCAYELWLGRRC